MRRLVACLLVPVWGARRSVFFLLSTTPSRTHRLPQTLRAMDAQTLRPTRVILTVPSVYKSLPAPLRIPDVGGARLSALLEVHRISRDAGPLNKYFGVGRVEDDDAVVVVGKAGVHYAPTFVEDLVEALQSHDPGTVVVASQLGDDFGRLSPGVVAQGGVACYARQLRQMFVKYALGPPRACYHADDALATHYFKRSRGDSLVRAPLRAPNVVSNASRAARKSSARCLRALLETPEWPQIPFRGPASLCEPDAAAARGLVAQPIGRGASWWQNYWEPCVGCAFERRVGPRGDGGKWVCDPDDLLRSQCAVLSVGSSNDFRFEQAMAEYGCYMHVYDHTSEPPLVWPGEQLPEDKRYMTRDGASRVTFLRQALGTSDTALTVTLATAVRRLLTATGATNVNVVKLDCEGCEFRALVAPSATKTLARQVMQFAVELHFEADSAGPPWFGDSARRMHSLWVALHGQAGMWPFHKEANIQFSRGDCVELAFVNRRLAGGGAL